MKIAALLLASMGLVVLFNQVDAAPTPEGTADVKKVKEGADELFRGLSELSALIDHRQKRSPTPDWKETVNEIVEGVDGILSGIIGWWNEARHKRSTTPELTDDLKAVVNGVDEILRKISGELSRH